MTNIVVRACSTGMGGMMIERGREALRIGAGQANRSYYMEVLTMWSQCMLQYFSSRILRRVGSMVLVAIKIYMQTYELRNAWSLLGYIVLGFPFFLLSLRALLEVSLDLLVSLASSSVFFSLNLFLSPSSVYPSLLPLCSINMSANLFV